MSPAILLGLLTVPYEAPCQRQPRQVPTRAGPSSLLASHLRDLLRWGVIEEGHNAQLPRTSGRLFLSPKGNGTQSRALFDGRQQNSTIDWCSLQHHGKFHILPPFYQILVGLGIGRENPRMAEVDFTSFFFQFQWGDVLARSHSFFSRRKNYVCRAPVQGCALMPLVAQTTSSILADAPPPRADPWDFVRSGVSIIYDNILLSGEEQDLERRWARLLSRCSEANAVLGDTQPPTRSLTSCGLEFDVTDPGSRKWRVSTAWSTKAADWITATRPHMTDDDRPVLAGLAQWAMSALLLPYAFIRRTLEGVDARAEIDNLILLLRSKPWRQFRCVPTEHPPRDAALVITDASGTGAGIIYDGKALALPWAAQRSPEQQQAAEWDAAILGIEHAVTHLPKGRTILLVTDNSGLIAGLLKGNPTTQRAGSLVRRLQANETRGPLWLAYVASEENPADRPSRSPKGSSAVTWPHPLEEQWRRTARPAWWTFAASLLEPEMDQED